MRLTGEGIYTHSKLNLKKAKESQIEFILKRNKAVVCIELMYKVLMIYASILWNFIEKNVNKAKYLLYQLQEHYWTVDAPKDSYIYWTATKNFFNAKALRHSNGLKP